MKRSMSESEDPSNETIDVNNITVKKMKLSEDQTPVTDDTAVGVMSDENLLYEVLKHVDARTLGTASCVCKQWNRTAHDERLWGADLYSTLGEYGLRQQPAPISSPCAWRFPPPPRSLPLAVIQAVHLHDHLVVFFHHRRRNVIELGVAVPTTSAYNQSLEAYNPQNTLGKRRGSTLAVSSLNSLLREDEFH